jgi:hypothetical protein
MECVMRLSLSVTERGSSTISAAGFLYKLCGSSQPSILKGSDGRFYVVKFNGFPEHQALANEVVGASLVRLFGLPAPAWSPIEISSDFIDEHPEMWFFRDGGDPIKPRPGLHFGSRLIEANGEQRTYQMIPSSWIDRIENRSDFLGMLVLDLWANNCDRRQAVFLSNRQHRLHASFIDNDFMLGGKFGSDVTCPRRAMVYDLDVYQDLWTKAAMRGWLGVMGGISDNALREIIHSIPNEWASTSTRWEILNQLRTRRSLLPRLLEEAQDVLRTGYSLRYHRARNATEPGQLCRSLTFPKAAV